MRSVLQSTAFRRVAFVSVAFCAAAFVLFAFIYWQTAVFETRRIERLVEHQAASIAAEPGEQALWTVNTSIARDLHRVTFAALFDPVGTAVAGNLRTMPEGLPLNGRAYRLDPAELDPPRPEEETVFAVGRLLADGRILVVGRNVDQLSQLRSIVERALQLGLIPALVLGLGFGVLVGHRTNQRIKAVQTVLERVRRGQLAERLPVRDSRSDFDQLAIGVNHMLSELERLLHELDDIGNNIAHDLRTPLARLRAQLERARRVSNTREELAEAVDQALLGLDQTVEITTALLRIARIDHAQRGASFASLDLPELAREVLELYAPIAEAKGIDVRAALAPVPAVYGDRALLLEVVANLMDNAVKFTPAGGHVRLALLDTAAGPMVEVADTGPGIAPEHRAEVFTRFQRLDRSREGYGLGLSLVQAIVRAHNFSIAISGAPGQGCIVRLLCTPPDSAAPAPVAAPTAAAVTAAPAAAASRVQTA